MSEAIKKVIIDPKTTFSSRSVMISLLVIISWAIFWVSWLQNKILNNTSTWNTLKEAISNNAKAIDKLPERIQEKLEANNDKLALQFDERYQKKN